MADKRNKTVCGTQPITAVLPNFLRVNAQMHNLDKQKTRQGRKTLPARLVINFSIDVQLLADYIDAATILSINPCSRFISERPRFLSFTKHVVTITIFKSGITQINWPP